MSLWREFFEGVAEGTVNALSRQSETRSHHHEQQGQIEQLCDELGWSVDDRSGNSLYLDFKSRYGLRRVQVVDGDDSIITFCACSSATLRARDIPVEMLVYLLRRNMTGDCVGMWAIHIDNNNVSFHVIYQPLRYGIDAEMLKHICQSLIRETVDFDDKLREEGLLR